MPAIEHVAEVGRRMGKNHGLKGGRTASRALARAVAAPEALSQRPDPKQTMLGVPRVATVFACATLVAAGLARAEDQRTPIPIAVADFDYVDTSGEARDQRAEHEARLHAFMQAIRNDLIQSGQYRLVALVCSQTPCPANGSAQLIRDARSSGAALLLYGGIHKESTLLQWMKVEAVEVESGNYLFNRLMTFRGDTDESWMHSERFLMKQIGDATGMKAAEHP